MSPPTADLPTLSSATPIPPVLPSWKNEVSARVRAHRSRRAPLPENQPVLPGLENVLTPSTVAARVAERYARVPSYREVLAAQAAAAEAQAAAEARAAAARIALAGAPPTPVEAYAGPARPSDAEAAPSPSAPEPWQPDLLRYFVSSDSLPPPPSTPEQARVQAHQSPDRARPADDPMEDALVEPAHPLPARVLAFPRELIAPRKARPRLAEGPLWEDGSGAVPVPPPAPLPPPLADPEALRIVEAEPEGIPGPLLPHPPDWLSIHLDAEASMPPPKQSARNPLLEGLPLHVAPLADRAMAAVVDFSLTLAAFLLFIVVFAACTTHLPGGRIALVGAGVVLLVMSLLYQFLFFTLTDATPGMRYAKIALCTFDDDNPSRPALRGRIAALFLSALPLGLGFLWSLFDEDTLGWHDRITRTYQRSYRVL